MSLAREEYIPPVGFAREPAHERRRWIGRVLLLFVVAGLAWLLMYRVISPQDNIGRPTGTESQLPGPI